MATFAKPENALKRAEELVNVGQNQSALQALHDLITSKRYRAWQKTLEKIMFKYVELCVDMRRGRFAKDGLIQYRIICQQVNVSSLEEVIKHFMALSTERAEQARSQAEALDDALDFEDLEADRRPEDLMLSYVSGEKGKDRSDRELVTPWFKFLWETYRTVLEIFWVSDSYLYHAYAWLILFTLQKSCNKNLSQKDLQLIASSVLLASLSVMPYDHRHGASHLELENEKERNLRMASLLGFNFDLKHDNREALSRSSLLSELASKDILSCISQEVKDLYNLLEHEFLLLDLASRVQPLLAKISKLGSKLSSASSVPEVQLSQYIPALEKLTNLRVLQQVSQVYRSMKFETLSRMIPFSDLSAVEKMSVDAQKYNFVAMKFDHVKGAVHFGNQDIESDQLSDYLTIFTQSLNNARSLIHPPPRKITKLGESVINLADTLEREHKRLLVRKSIIEKRKEEHERQMLEIEREVESEKQKQQKIIEETEKIRLQNEVAIREKERIRREIEEKEHQEALQMLKDAQKHQKKGKKPIIEGVIFQQRIDSRREVEFNRLKQERDDRIREQVAALKRDREIKRKLLFFLKSEERLTKLHKEEEARKREEAERKKKEDAEKQAKLDEILEKQKRREKELEEKDKLLMANFLVQPWLAEPGSPARPKPAPTAGKYVPRLRRLAEAGKSPSAVSLGQSMPALLADSPDTDFSEQPWLVELGRPARPKPAPAPTAGKYVPRLRRLVEVGKSPSVDADSGPPLGVSKLPWRRN